MFSRKCGFPPLACCLAVLFEAAASSPATVPEAASLGLSASKAQQEDAKEQVGEMSSSGMARIASWEQPRRLRSEHVVRLTDGASAGRATEPPKVVHDAIDPGDARELREALREGRSTMCCGHWQSPVAARLQQRVASELGIPIRGLGDVHLSNASSRIVSSTSAAGMWGAVAVVYLESPGASRAVAHNPDGSATTQTVSAAQHSLVVVPEGGQLVHAVPQQVAWIHIRRQGVPHRSVVDYYVVAWVRANFVAPYDTDQQRVLFGSFTNYPRYWHAFLFSFIGMLLTALACLPLAWRAIQEVDRLYLSEPGPSKAPAAAAPPSPAPGRRPLPTLLSQRGGNGPSSMARGPTKPGCEDKLSAREPLV